MSDLRSGPGPREASDASEATAPRLARPLPPRPSATRAIAVDGVAGDPLAQVRAPVARKPRPDPGPIRIAIGLTGLATASALVTAFLGTAGGAAAGAGTVIVDQAAAAAPAAVRHVTQYVQLAPGQTAPPAAVVQQAPAPKPRVVVVTTRQSGKP